MNKKIIIIAIVAAIAVVAGYLFLGKDVAVNEISPETKKIVFISPKKAAHYEGNVPEHGMILAGAPVNVVIDFNFDLAANSSISIKMGDKDYGIGETIIDSGNLAMRKKMDPAAPDGLYDVFYRACWADGSCHDGNFQFAISRALAEKFSDMRGSSEITILLENFKFNPKEVLISRGTKVNWINKDSVIHTVNTDNHPEHTYFLEQNSRNLKQGDNYAATFNEPGIYPYHCTPHAPIMTGVILVE